MKIILIVIIAISFNKSFASQSEKYDVSTRPVEPTRTKEKSELAKKVEGTYALAKNSNVECLPEGDLSVTTNEDNTQTLMMGGRVLAAGIGRNGKISDHDVNCNYTYETSYAGNVILATDTQECDQREITFHKKIEIQKNKLIINRDAVENEKVVSQIKCVFNKITSDKKSN